MRFCHLAAAAVVLAATPAAADDCSLIRIVSVEMQVDAEGGVTVPMTVSGRTSTPFAMCPSWMFAAYGSCSETTGK